MKCQMVSEHGQYAIAKTFIMYDDQSENIRFMLLRKGTTY